MAACLARGPYGANPPISPGEVADFETEHKIQLPAEYRIFLTHVGNGGRWPGVFQAPLGYWGDNNPWRQGDGVVGSLATSFALYGAWNDQSGRPAVDQDLEDAEDPEYLRLHEEWSARYFDRSRLRGAMPLHDYECNMHVWLVVSGSQAGCVWYESLGNDEGIYPFKSPLGGGPLQFLDWFRWRVLSALRRFRNA